jgi:hypothetical protein
MDITGISFIIYLIVKYWKPIFVILFVAVSLLLTIVTAPFAAFNAFQKTSVYNYQEMEKAAAKNRQAQGIEIVGTFEGSLNTTAKVVTYGGFNYPLPVYIPNNKQMFYALIAMRVPEFGVRPLNSPDGERDSCGTYQQRVGEYMPGTNNQKTKIAREVLGSEYDRIFTPERVAFVNANNAAAAGKPYAITYPSMMREICQDLANNHVKTGLFDKIQIVRFAERGLKTIIENYPLGDGTVQMGLFIGMLCASHAPLRCSSWEATALVPLKTWYREGVFDKLPK